MKKINLLQKGFIMLVLALFVLPSSLPAHANQLATPLQQETQVEVAPLWIYSETRTVKLTFDTYESMLSNYHYEYYHNIYGTMRGVLTFKSYEVVKKEYVATYSGTMYSNPL